MRTDQWTTKKDHSVRKQGWKWFLILLIAAQLLLIGVRTSQKVFYHIDELYTLGYTHAFAYPDKYVFLDDWKAYRNGEWTTAGTLRQFITVTKEDSVLTLPPVTLLKRFAVRRNYYGILSAVMGLAAPGKLTVRPAVALNMLFHILAVLLLCRILRRFSCPPFLLLAVAIMYGFSVMTVGIAMFARFYCWVELLILAILLLHVRMWEETKPLRFFGFQFLFWIFFYLAFKCSQLMMILGGALGIFYTAALLIYRKYRKAAGYFFPSGSAFLLYFLLQTDLLNVLFHPGQYAGMRGAKGWTTENVVSATPASAR